MRRTLGLAMALAAGMAELPAAQAQDAAPGRDSVALRFIDADLRLVVQALGQSLSKPLLMVGIPGVRVTLETPTPVPRSAVPGLLAGLVEAHGLELREEAEFFKVQQKPAPVVQPTPPVGPAADRTPQDAEVALHVIRLKHARAADVAATINLLFGGTGAFAGGGGIGETLSDELRGQLMPPVQPGPPAGGRTERGGNGAFAGDVTIVPDELTNSLLVRATAEDFATLAAAVEQVDIRPLQVLIEVLIVEARRDRGFSLNTSLFKPEHGEGEPTTWTGQVQAGSSGLSDLVIRLMNLGKADIDAALAVSETRGEVSIVSRPVLLASNNTEARFLVGSQRPFVQVSRSLPTDAPQRDQVIQYRDVGTKLRVRPTINQDGYVALQIQQEVNAATGEVAFDAPVISTREAVTQLLVRDGQTIVIGGLTDQQQERNSSGVPLLSGLPLIGGLFGGSSRRATRTELYLFLTPRILRDDPDVDRVTQPRRDAWPED
jgi:general secretion pathway protein D